MENDTQVCDLSWNRTQEPDDDPIDRENNTVAVFSIKGQKLLIYPGKKYVIGRGNEASLSVPIKSLSKQHIQIEYVGGSHLITDLGSKNKTRRGQLVLQPNVVYELPHNAKLLLGDTEAMYHYIQGNTETNWLDVATDQAPTWSSTPAKTVRIREDVQAVEISADGESSDVEAVPASQFIPQLDESSLLYVEDSPQNSPLKESSPTSHQIPETPAAKPAGTRRDLQLDISEDLAKDTSLLNRMKELNTLAQFQANDSATTIPNTQFPDTTFDEEASECGSLVVDLNEELGEPEKIAETQVAPESEEGGDCAVGAGGACDEMNTQCWEMAVPSEEEEEEEKEEDRKEEVKGEIDCGEEARSGEPNQQKDGDNASTTEQTVEEEHDTTPENDCDTTAETASEDGTDDKNQPVSEPPPPPLPPPTTATPPPPPPPTTTAEGKEDVESENTEVSGTERGSTGGPDCSDMEITCVDENTTNLENKPGVEVSMLSEGVSGGFSPTSAPATEDDNDSEATDMGEELPSTPPLPDPLQEELPSTPPLPDPLPPPTRRATRTLTPQPEESLIESPVMSESELENSIDRRDKYRRSMVQSMAEDSQMWATIMSTKTSSSGSNTQEDVEKTPPREDFADDDLARTPPRSVSERPNPNPVTTPTKILEVKAPVQLVEMAGECVEGDFEETQELPNIPMEEEEEDDDHGDGELQIVDEKETDGIVEECIESPSQDKECQIGEDSETDNNKIDQTDDRKDTEDVKEDTVDDDEGVVLVLLNDEDTLTDEDDRPGDAKEETANEDDELKITSIQNACSLEITHFKDSDSVYIEDAPCTLDLDVKVMGGTEDFDVKVKGEPSSEDKKEKTFISMFDSDEDDCAVYDSQLNTLADDDGEHVYDLISPVKKSAVKKKKSPVKKKTGAGRGRKVKPKEDLKPKPPSRRNKKATLNSDTEEEEEKEILKKETKRGRKKFKVFETESEEDITELAPVSKQEHKETKGVVKKPPSTILKLDSVEELLRKRREVKQKLDAKEITRATTRAKGKKKTPRKALDEEDDLPEFGLLDGGSDDTDSDEVVELDLITSCSKPAGEELQSGAGQRGAREHSGAGQRGAREHSGAGQRVPPLKQEAATGGSRKRKASQTLPEHPKKEKVSDAAPPSSPKRATRVNRLKRPLSESEESHVSIESVRVACDSQDTQDSIASSRSTRLGRKKVSVESESQKSKRTAPKSSTEESSRRGRKKQIIDTSEDEEGDTLLNTHIIEPLPVKTESKTSSKAKKNAVPVKRVRKKQVIESPSEDEDDDDEENNDPDHDYTPVKRKSGRPAKSSPVIDSPGPSRRRTASSLQGSPAPTVSKRGRSRKVRSDVRAFLEEAKNELGPRSGRGRRGVSVKEEVVDEEEEEEEEVVVKTEPKTRRGGGKKQEPDVKQEKDVSPVITVGRGKRKKTSGPAANKDAASPSAAIVNVNKANKQGKTLPTYTPRRSVTVSRRVEIVYTGITPDAPMKRAIAALGGVLSTDIATCTHLVTDKIKRTAKFLCAIGRGIPIVSESWLKESKKSKTFVDASDFVIKDKDTEKKYKFVLTKSLETARHCPFLSGWSLFVTKSCEPTPEQIEPIISCNGGTMLKKAPKASDHNVIVVATSDDKLTTLSRSGAPICSPELVLTGALRQELSLADFSLRDKSPEL